MPFAKIRSSSESSLPTSDNQLVGVKKTGSLPDVHGKLSTPAGILPVRLTEPENIPRGTEGLVSSLGRTIPSSHHQVELVQARDLPQVQHGDNTPQTENQATAPVQSRSYTLLETGLLLDRPQVGGSLASVSMLTPPKTPVTDVHRLEAAELQEEASRVKESLSRELSASSMNPQEGKKKTKQPLGAQQASTQTTGKDHHFEITEVKRLIKQIAPERLKETGGNLTELDGFNEIPHKAELASNDRLLRMFSVAYKEQSKGGKSFPDDFADKLIDSLEKKIAEAVKPKTKISTEKSKATSKVKKVDKPTLEHTPGLKNMFLARALNNLITGELHKLDPLVGDEGCQLRTPFTLDMYDLVQGRLKKSPFRSTAHKLVSEYREATGEEQNSAIARMKELEKLRTGNAGEQEYEKAVRTFDYQLTDEAKGLLFPDQCPIDITGSKPESKMNITEEFQLLSRLAEAAHLEDVRYAMENKQVPGEALRLADKTIPFSIKHIFASTYKHENAMSRHYAKSSQGVKAGRRHKISELDRHEH